MATRKTIRRDSMNRLIESALHPGSYISYYDGSAFVSGLLSVEKEIEALIPGNPPVR